jgi:hypothetical protein
MRCIPTKAGHFNLLTNTRTRSQPETLGSVHDQSAEAALFKPPASAKETFVRAGNQLRRRPGTLNPGS